MNVLDALRLALADCEAVVDGTGEGFTVAKAVMHEGRIRLVLVPETHTNGNPVSAE